MTHLGQTDRYYGVTLELFRLRNDDAGPGGSAPGSGVEHG
jgi:hypothetical protein